MVAETSAGNGVVLIACGSCGEPLDARDRFCEVCGRSRSTVPAVTAGAEEGGPPLQCTDCGSPAISAEGYCDECGLRQPNGREHLEIELAVPDSAGSAGPMRAGGVTDVGLRRSRNEDALAMAVLPGVVCAVVCDGVASAPGSEEAALAAADTGAAVLARRLTVGSDHETATRAAARCAAEAVTELAGFPHTSPACTYVSVIAGPAAVTVGWVGDSRAYWLHRDPARAAEDRVLTKDDSWAVRMVARRAMSAEEAWADPRAQLLTAWLGADAGSVDPHVVTFVPDGPGVLLVCSDGLWHHFPEPVDLAAVLAAGPDAAAAPLTAARELVQAALDAGGHDNVTVALVPYPRPLTEPTREPDR